MHKSKYGLYICMKQQSHTDNSAFPSLVTLCCTLAFQWYSLRFYLIYKVNASLYSKNNKQFLFVCPLNFKPQLSIQDSKKSASV